MTVCNMEKQSVSLCYVFLGKYFSLHRSRSRKFDHSVSYRRGSGSSFLFKSQMECHKILDQKNILPGQ